MPRWPSGMEISFTLWTSNQMIDWCRTDLAKTLKVPVENVRIISPYIGGGFGGKLFLRSDALLAALAARAVKRPVKVMLPAPLFPLTPRTALPPFSTLAYRCRPERENHRYPP